MKEEYTKELDEFVEGVVSGGCDGELVMKTYREILGRLFVDKQRLKEAMKKSRKKCPMTGTNLMVIDWYEQYMEEVLGL